MSSLERKLERINRILGNLKDEASTGVLIIVEGQKDVETLRTIGVESDILAIKSYGKTITDLVDEIKKSGKKEVILLMDFDRRGRELTERLVQSFEKIRVKPNVTFWKDLCSLMEKDLKDIEGLLTYIQTLKEKIGKQRFYL